MAKKLSKRKACVLLHEKKAKSERQRRFFGARCNPKKKK